MGKSALREAEEVEALRAGIELGMSVVDTAEMPAAGARPAG